MTLLVPNCKICDKKIGFNEATPNPKGDGWVHKKCLPKKEK
jgi:hypothetical protein